MNLISQKSPNITTNADKNPLQANIRNNATKRVLLDIFHGSKNANFQE